MATKREWTDRAVANLNHIYDFIAQDSDTYAFRFTKRLVIATEKRLKHQAFSGRHLPEFQDTPLNFLREVIFKRYRIIYNPKHAPEKVTIVAVMSGRMDLIRHVKPEWVI